MSINCFVNFGSKENNMGKVVGIDFGIINLVVVVMEGGKFIVIVNVEGMCIIFFVVGFNKEGELVVG